MEWEEPKSGFFMAEADSAIPREEALREFCDKASRDVLPRNVGVDWNVLRVEIWEDSGRIILFPACFGKPERVERSACQSTFEEFLRSYEPLLEFVSDDDAFETHVERLVDEWASAFMVEARRSQLRGTRVAVFNADDEPAIRDEVL